MPRIKRATRKKRASKRKPPMEEPKSRSTVGQRKRIGTKGSKVIGVTSGIKGRIGGRKRKARIQPKRPPLMTAVGPTKPTKPKKRKPRKRKPSSRRRK
jgi:hypothetical protein